MIKYMLAYHGGTQPATREEGMAQMNKWQEWVASLGDKVVNPGTPLPEMRLVTSAGVSEAHEPDGLNGFAVVTAASMDDAVAIAQSDPFLGTNGTIRVYRMMEM